MHPQLHPPHLLFFLIVFTFIFPISLCDYDERYSKCTPNTFNCGNISRVQYPFTGNGRSSYCGYPGFELECGEDNATIEIMSERYRVLEIDDRKQTLKIARMDFLDSICVQPFSSTTLNFTLFNYHRGYKNLTLFYGCSSTIAIPAQVTCPQAVQFMIGEGEVPTNELIEEGGCETSITVPIVETAVKALSMRPWTLNAVLNEGFEVRWLVDNAQCLECMQSGGRCGISPTLNPFTCFCPDQPYESACPTGVATTQPGASTTRSNGKSSQTGKVIGIGAGAGALLVLALLFFYCYRRRRSRSRSGHLLALAKSKDISPSSTPFTVTPISNPPLKMDVEKGGSTYFGVPIFSYDELVEATNNFDSNKELGEGGFGTVYHGKLRDGRVVAVKRLYENTFKRVEQFMNEVEILTRLRHQNLVTLYGCTSRHSRELLLVYEYIPNGTVADHLHGDRARTGPLTWPIRMSIAIETASALSYLHATDIIHRDVKSNNILLDNNFRVKVADFGLSRLFPPDVSHVSTAPQGTPGYVDPEYHQCYQLTDKSDVYSFGVVLIELISSKPAVDTSRHRYEINLANMAMNKIQNQTLHELVDPALGFESNYDITRMATQVAELAFRCLQLEREMRPTMDEVLDALRKIENEEYTVEKAEVVVIPSDDVGLLKSCPPPVSPDSVTEKWVSWSSTPPSATVSI